MANLKLSGNTFDAVHMGKFLNCEFGESVIYINNINIIFSLLQVEYLILKLLINGDVGIQERVWVISEKVQCSHLLIEIIKDNKEFILINMMGHQHC